jgi:hypothetical protein
VPAIVLSKPAPQSVIESASFSLHFPLPPNAIPLHGSGNSAVDSCLIDPRNPVESPLTLLPERWAVSTASYCRSF